MSAYVEQVFNDVEKMRGKVLADRFRMVFKKIQLVKNDDSDEAYNLKQQENLAAVTELQNAGGFIDWDIKVTKYSNTSTQVELRHKVDGVLVWRDFTFVSDFVFELAKNVVYSKRDGLNSIFALITGGKMEQLTPAKLDSMITETTTELLYAQRALISPSRADAMEKKASQLLSILLELKELRNKSPQKNHTATPACCFADHSYPAYSRDQVIAILDSLGHKIIEKEN